MSTKKSNKQGNKFIKYMKAPVRMLTKARDCYIGSMIKCSDNVAFVSSMGCPAGHVNALPRSFSVSSSRSSNNDDDLAELVRVASIKSLGSSIELDLLRRQKVMRQSPAAVRNNLPRSYSVGIGRIDEDRPCDFEDDLKVLKPAIPYPRSRSYAVSRGTGLVSPAKI